MRAELTAGRTLAPDIRGDWEKVMEHLPHRNPFLTPLWADLWLKHFGGSADAKALVFRDEKGILRGIGQVTESAEGGGRGLTLTGGADLWDYRDFVVQPGWEEQVFQSLAVFLHNAPFNFIELNGIAEKSPTARFFPASLETSGLRVSRMPEDPVLNIHLPDSWEEFLGGLGAKDRHELRRKIRRAEREGPCAWVKETGPADLPEKMGLFLDLHRRSRRDKSEFMTAEREAFFRDLAEQLLKNGWLDLSFLRFRDRFAAAFFSFDFGGKKYVYNSGYDPEFSRYSPGIVLSAYCLRGAIAEGLKEFNFLRGREEYKYRLGAREEANFRLRAEKV